MQRSIGFDPVRAERTKYFARWLADFIRERAFVDDCRHAIALAAKAESYPYADEVFAGRLAGIWETAATADCTIVGACIAASMRRFNGLTDTIPGTICRRISDGMNRQKWGGVKNPDMMLAAFAAGYARLGAFEEGCRVIGEAAKKHSNAATVEAYSAILLGLERRGDEQQLNSFIARHRTNMGRLDTVFSALLLSASGIRR